MNKRIELLPESYLLRQMIRARSKQWAIVAAVAVLVTLVVALSVYVPASSLQMSLVPLRQKVASAEGWEATLAGLAVEVRSALERRRVVDALVHEPHWCGLLSDVASATSRRLWLTGFDVSTESVESEDEALPGGTRTVISISGKASSNDDVIRFVRILSRSDHIEDVELSESKMPGVTGGEVQVQFRIQGTASLGRAR